MSTWQKFDYSNLLGIYFYIFMVYITGDFDPKYCVALRLILWFNTFSLSLLDCLKSSKRSMKYQKVLKNICVKDCTFEASNVFNFSVFHSKASLMENLLF